MNIVNNALLKLALLPKGPYTKMGVDMDHLKTILTTKLIMDDRRPLPIQQIKQTDQKVQLSSVTILTMFFSALMGSVYLLVFIYDIGYVSQMTLYFTFFICMLSLILISDFTIVLLDVRDNFILMPKPISDKTIVVARLLHILIHVTKMVFPMYLPGLIYFAIAEGFYACLIFVVLIFFATLISVFLINAFYIFVLKVTTPEKFRRVIGVIQIFFTMLFYIGFRSFSFAFDKLELAGTDLFHSFWWVLMPSYWFGSAFNILYTGQGSNIQYIGMIMAFILPVLTIYIVIKYLAPSFNRKLSMISGSGTGDVSKENQKDELNKRTFVDALSTFVTNNNQERAGFQFNWKMMSRTRDFKMRTYPSLGYIVFIAGLFLYRAIMKSHTGNLHMPEGFQYVGVVYAIAIVVSAVIRQMNFSDHYTAGWVFYSSPVYSPGQIVSGALKAVFLKYSLIIFLLVSILALSLEGFHLMPDLILAYCNVIFLNYFIVYMSKRSLPFSQPLNAKYQAMQVQIMLLIGLISAIVGVIHYFIFGKIYFILLGIIFSVGMTFMLSKSIKESEWSKFNLQQ